MPPTTVRELDDDSIALLLQAYVDQMVDYQLVLCAAPLEKLCAALYGPGRCGGDGDAGAEQRLWKYACEKMGLTVLPVYPGGPPTWRHAFLALCNEVATLTPEALEAYRELLRGDDAYEDGPKLPVWYDDDSEDDDADEEAPPQRHIRVAVVQFWFLAVERGLWCVMHYLLRRVDGIVNYGDDWALSRASREGQLAVVEVLLAHGADVHARDDGALRYASGRGHLAVVEFLLAHGADVHAHDDGALHVASVHGRLAVVEFLLVHGANVHADGDWALRRASMYGHLAVVEVLLAHGADVHVLNDAALSEASERGHLAVVQALRAAGATE